MYKKLLGYTFALALVLVLPFTSSAAVVGSLNLNSIAVFQGGNISLSGDCGSVSANSTVSFQLVHDGVITSIGPSVIANSAGQFGTTVSTPVNYPLGPATLIAVCPNSNTVTAAINMNKPIGTVLNISPNPTLGNNINVSGSCGTTQVGGLVNIRLARVIGGINLGTITTTDGTGSFSGTFTIPSNAGGGPAVIDANCPTGLISANVVITDPAASVSVSNSTVNAGGSITLSGFCGTTPGGNVGFLLANSSTQANLGSTLTSTSGAFNATLAVPDSFSNGAATLVAFCPTGNLVTTFVLIGTGSTSTSTSVSSTPTGGVAAGSGASVEFIGALMLLVTGVVGIIASKRKENYLNDF